MAASDQGRDEHIDRLRTHLLQLRNWQLKIHTSVAHLICRVVQTRMAEMLSKKDAELIHDGMTFVADAIKDASLKVDLGNSFLHTVTPEVYSEKQIFEELENIGLPEQFRLDAYVYLIRNPSTVRAVFAVPSELRLELLYKFMQG